MTFLKPVKRSNDGHFVPFTASLGRAGVAVVKAAAALLPAAPRKMIGGRRTDYR
jgi:hypothetical protein